VCSFCPNNDYERRFMWAIFLLANRICSSAETFSLIATAKQEETSWPVDWCMLALIDKTALLTNFGGPLEWLNIVWQGLLLLLII